MGPRYYKGVMRRLSGCIGFLVLSAALAGCATKLGPIPARVTGSETIAFGQVAARLSAPTSRYYTPQIRFLELVNRETDERFRIDVQAAESPLVLAIPAGTYEVSRVMINEGAFQAMANPGPVFQVGAATVTYIGTWTFDIAAPAYNRKITLTVHDELDKAKADLSSRYPVLSTRPITTRLPTPPDSVARLYEKQPYPLIWYFRRHHTT